MNSPLILTFPTCLAVWLTAAAPSLPAQNLPKTEAVNAVPAVAAKSPSGLYLQGHLVLKDGTEKEGKGDFAGAYFKFRDARDLFDSAYEADRTWNAEIVEYRRRKIREDMERVRLAEIQRRAAGGPPSPSGVIGNASGKDLTIERAQPAGGSSGARNTAVVMEERLRGMQAQIDALTKRNEEVVTKLGASEQSLREARAAGLDARSAEKALRQSLADAQTKLATAEPAAKRKNEDLTKRVEKLEQQLGSAMSQLSAANSKSGNLLGELEKAYGEIKDRTRERDEIKRERDQMEVLLAGADGGKAPEKLKIIAENHRLKKELEAAEANVAKLTAEKTADQQEIAALRGQLQGIQEQVTRFQQESEDYRQQIKALTERLDATNLRLAETGAGAVPEFEASQENKVLRGIILQQMKQQAKRETARKNIMEDLAREGVLESMKNLGVETARVYRALNDMASSPAMTREQRGVLSNTRLDQFLIKNGVGDLMMVQDSQALKEGASANPGTGGPESIGARTKEELTPELKAYANAAEVQFNQGSYGEAESQYRKILMIEPMNVHALSNLGVVQVNQGNYAEAEKSIKKALAYFYDSAPAHYLLGVIYMRQNLLDEAVEEIKESLKLEGKNANAHLTLGMIAAQRKKRGEAEGYFKQAIALDSSNATAHFNLAVLYATDERQKLDLARQHYRLARRYGANRDEKMDNLLGS